MKSFTQFMTEASIPDELAGGASIRQSGEGGRVYRKRKKSEAETRRVKAIGGGKTAPVAYKDRKDVGSQRKRSEVEQQPTKALDDKQVRQSYADKVKAERKKAAQARIAARKSGGEVKTEKPRAKETEKKATELLKKKTTKTVAPGYKPAKASGMTRAERDKRRGEGERMLKGIMKDQETSKYKKETGTNPDAKGRTKILGRVNKRMSESLDDRRQSLIDTSKRKMENEKQNAQQKNQEFKQRMQQRDRDIENSEREKDERAQMKKEIKHELRTGK